MTGHIDKFDKPRQSVKILGANEIIDKPPLIMDRTTKQEQDPIEIRQHSETIVEADKIRGPKPRAGRPEVRVRTQTNPVEWDKVKRGKDE